MQIEETNNAAGRRSATVKRNGGGTKTTVAEKKRDTRQIKSPSILKNVEEVTSADVLMKSGTERPPASWRKQHEIGPLPRGIAKKKNREREIGGLIDLIWSLVPHPTPHLLDLLK
jgi:hypothetical protein